MLFGGANDKMILPGGRWSFTAVVHVIYVIATYARLKSYKPLDFSK